jgi:hypothetical protein
MEVKKNVVRALSLFTCDSGELGEKSTTPRDSRFV